MEESTKCFVPGCYNEVGVLFPKNEDVKQKWLRSLELEHLIPAPSSFICLDHFEEDGRPGQLPRIKKPKISVQTHTPTKTDVTSRPVSFQSTRISRRSLENSGIDREKRMAESPQITEDLKGSHQLNRSNVTRTYGSSKRKTLNDSTIVEKRELTEEAQNIENVCRLCLCPSTKFVSVWQKFDGKHTIAHAIDTCLHPLVVSQADKLSKRICYKCLKSLGEFFTFHQFCQERNERQKELLISQEASKDDYNADSESEDYLHVERLSDYEENKENQEECINGKVKTDLFKNYLTNQESNVTDGNTVNNKSDIDKKFDQVEEQLMKVLEGQNVEAHEANNGLSSHYESEPNNTDYDQFEDHSSQHYETVNKKTVSTQQVSKTADDTVYTEDIIIEMVEDENNQQTIPNSLVNNLGKLPITIKRIQGDKKIPLKRKYSEVNNEVSNSYGDNATMIQGTEQDEVVVIPRGIKVEIKEKYSSPLGKYPSKNIKYLFNSDFVLANDYLYEFSLCKNEVRNLNCAVINCPAKAVLTKTTPNSFINIIEVIQGHNHEVPDSTERKKQMFFSIMFKKMQKDKNFNFKTLYEQMCKLDNSLEDILPLRKVISEICKKGPIERDLPMLNSFEDFYYYIESDNFGKLHFNESNVQFYQERFETDEGSKAVVFANPDIIRNYSYSNLMYVDASFHTGTQTFYYQMVTVLVWTKDESYYPIMYAFVNKKSQEIFKQIFGFLYNTLAPNLRPEEIITDYEANLYYSLGETYIESSIGGSVFYFTQNLYKKICELKQCKLLEVDSNFRSIYNMLLMLPLLPVNTMADGLKNIQVQAKETGVEHLTEDLFKHVQSEWMEKVTPELFCVHRLESRINENIVAPFKKLRDLMQVSKNKKSHSSSPTIVHVIEKLIELDKFLIDMYKSSNKKMFIRDLSSSQKKMVIKAWNFIESFPKININNFFMKVLGYIKCMENQLWIWGFYRYEGDTHEDLINAANFSIINDGEQVQVYEEGEAVENQEEEEEQGQVMKTEVVETEVNDEEHNEPSEIIEEYYIEEGGTIRKVVAGISGVVSELSEPLEQSDEYHVQILEEHETEDQAPVEMEAVLDEHGSLILQNKTDILSEHPVDTSLVSYVNDFVA